jgi:hypothetical protein
MHKNAVVLIGRNGDLANAIPMAKHLHDTTGEKPLWFVHRMYLAILKGVTYVEPVPVVLDLHRVDLAVRMAKEKAATIINATSHGKFYKGARDASYNFKAWVDNGFGDGFHDLVKYPLVFDARDAERESILASQVITTDKPVMLISLARAKSSPFAHHALFEERIRRKWGKVFQIVDLQTVNAARIYDLLGLMDRARILITADTATLHLATAAPTLKTICLTNDNPFLASRPRYQPVYQTSYSQALSNLEQVHEAIVRTVV